MLLVSWNVAAWPTVVNLIGDVSRFLERHCVDILCLQEVKVGLQRLKSGDAKQLGASLEGWETFWAPCRDEATKGFQGVATWAKTGTTLRADPAPLRDPSLDAQGRCICTEHAAFVIFNVYAPAGSNSGGISFRMKFYTKLREAMHRMRQATGKAVILCGDLNVCAQAIDCHFLRARIRVPDWIQGKLACACGRTTSEVCCEAKQQIVEAWPRIQSALNSRSTRMEKSRSSATGEQRERYRLLLTLYEDVGDGRIVEETVKVGKLQDSPEICLEMFNIKPSYWTDPCTGMEELLYPENALCVGELHELMKVVAKVEWNGRLLRALAKNAGESPNALPLLKLLHQGFLTQDGMVDSFRHLYPKATFRFTCWNQYTNGRYSNHGARIDYFLLDHSLVQAIQRDEPKHVELRCGCDNKSRHYIMFGEQAARCAATAGDRFKAAAFQGGGLEEASQSAIDTQFGHPHTGMIYTPPKYSDHIAVSLLLDDEKLALHACELDDKDKSTKQAQPHKVQPSIKNFFSKPSSTSSKAAVDLTVSPATRELVKSESLQLTQEFHDLTASSPEPFPPTPDKIQKKRPIAELFAKHSSTSTTSSTTSTSIPLTSTCGERNELKRKGTGDSVVQSKKKSDHKRSKVSKSIKDFFH